MNLSLYAQAKFWSLVEVGRLHECWLWRGGFNGAGYGKFYIPGSGRGAEQPLAHRISLELAEGTPSEGLEALHACDTPACVNPAHLRWDTHAANMREMSERGRSHGHFTDTCRRGHIRTEKNTGLKKNGRAKLARFCRDCARENDRIRRQKMPDDGDVVYLKREAS